MKKFLAGIKNFFQSIWNGITTFCKKWWDETTTSFANSSLKKLFFVDLPIVGALVAGTFLLAGTFLGSIATGLLIFAAATNFASLVDIITAKTQRPIFVGLAGFFMALALVFSMAYLSAFAIEALILLAAIRMPWLTSKSVETYHAGVAMVSALTFTPDPDIEQAARNMATPPAMQN